MVEEDQAGPENLESHDHQAVFSPITIESGKRCCPEGTRFEIRVRGHLDIKWSDWLEGMEATLLDNGEMTFTGPIADQSALMGILNKLSRLNLELISINQIEESRK